MKWRFGCARETYELLSRWAMVLLLTCACTDKKAAAPPKAVPQPLKPLEVVTADAGADTDEFHRVVPLSPEGPAAPENAVRVELTEAATLPTTSSSPVLLVPQGEVYLSQASGVLAELHDHGQEVWLQHPDAPVAFQLHLKDAPEFQRWLDEPVPGKVRVIHRADGFEVMTNMGKLPGQDANGPTVPTRGGQFDLTTLRRGLERVQARFKEAPDVCFVPSFGMEMRQVARAMAADFLAPDVAYFKNVCLVYPRPAPKP